MSLNVNKSDDAYYRYKMPRVVTKIEGKGNGIKTVIVNMSEIAKTLGRKSSYATKFFGIECGAQVQLDEKNDRYIVNGVHDAAKIQDLIYSFIQKFVLCSSCGNPETTYQIKKKLGIVIYRCKACGYVGEISRTHRLTQYIIKNPPDVEVEDGQDNEDGKDEDADSDGDLNGSCEQPVGFGVDGELDAPPEAADMRNEHDVAWSADASTDGMIERIKNLTSGAQKLTATNLNDEKSIIQTEGERGDLMLALVKRAKLEAGKGNSLSKDVLDELLCKKDEFRLRENVLLCFVEALLDSPETLLADIKLYQSVLFPLTRNAKAQRYLIGGFELLIAAHLNTLLDLTPKILHAAYNDDLLDEEIILNWHDRGASRRFVDKKTSGKIIEKATPFIKWLKEADVESSDEEEEALPTNIKGPPIPIVNETEEVNRKVADTLDDEDDSDVDIDDL